MSARGNVEVWVDATEEVIASEECHTSTVMEPTDTPIQKLLDTMVGEGGGGEGEEGFYDDGFDCHECRSMFQNQTDDISGGPSFILDSPTIMGGPQRALLSLPHGLMMARSSIPNAGLGIVNQGPTVSPGMHFGPYEGEVTTRADAMGSEYSWEICKGKDKWEYIDGASEMHSNWMRYVNCARNEQEKNLLVVQYKDSVMFHCCRPVQQGDELLVWPSDTLLSHLSPAWNQIWFMKQTPTATETTSTSMAYQNFSCHLCQLPFTTETYLQRHTEEFHTVRKKEKETPTTTSVVVLAVDQDPDPTKAKLCADCGKTFKLDHQLARHQRCVHANKKPYACPLCRQSFSQASGLLRHQLIHRKAGALIRESVAEPSQSDSIEVSETVERSVTGDTEQHDDTEEPEGMEGDDEMVMDEVEDSPDEQAETVKTRRAKSAGGANMCSECGKGFTNLGYLKKHKLTVHNHVRPYVCTVCRKSFGQHHDLARHLKQHKVKRSKTKIGHWCASCSLTFSTAHSLRQHAILLHLPREDPDVNALADAPDDDDQGDDPDFVVEPSVAKAAKSGKSPTKRRKQRLGTRKRKGAKKTAAAITKLIAPKRKGGKKAAATDPQAEEGGGEPEASTTKPVAKKRKGGKKAAATDPQAEEGGGEPEASTTKPVAKKRKGGKKAAVIDPQAEEGGGEPEEGGVEAEEGGVEAEEGGVEAEEGGGEAEEGGVEAEEGGGEEEEGGDEPEEEGDEPEESSASTSPQKDGDGKPRKWYICVQCKGTYESPGELKAHKCTATQHTCIQCGMVFKKSGFLKRHEKTVHADAVKSHRCDHCQTVFKKLSKLKLHQESCENHHYMSELFPCDYCEFSFTLKSYLRKHIRRHHPVEYISNPNDDDGGADQPEEGENLCPHCGKIYVSIKHFKAHACFQEMRVVFLCTDCGKGFSNHYGLKQHQRIHTGEKPYKCPHCVKGFSYVGQLNVHIRTHTGEKPYLCTHCGESFRQSGDLKRHERKHTGVKPHNCPTCSKSFSRLQSLKAHELLHLGQRKFTCSQCPWSFSRNYHLRRHHQKMHS